MHAPRKGAPIVGVCLPLSCPRCRRAGRVVQGAADGHGRAPAARCRRAAWLITFDPCYCRHLRQQILNVGTDICGLHQVSRVLDLQTCSTEPGSGLSEACVTAWPSGLHAMFLEWQDYKASPPAGHFAISRGRKGIHSASSDLCMQSEEWCTPRGHQEMRQRLHALACCAIQLTPMSLTPAPGCIVLLTRAAC